MDATCGGRGRCRSCRVKVMAGEIPPATLQDTLQLGHDEVHERFRLACQTRVISDCTVMPMPPKAESGFQILAGGVDLADSQAASRFRRREARHHREDAGGRAPPDFRRGRDPRLPAGGHRPASSARGAAQGSRGAAQGQGKAHRHDLQRGDHRRRGRRHLGARLRDGVRHRHHQHRRHADGPEDRRAARGRRRTQSAGAVRRRPHVAHRLRAVRRGEAGDPARQDPHRRQRFHQGGVRQGRGVRGQRLQDRGGRQHLHAPHLPRRRRDLRGSRALRPRGSRPAGLCGARAAAQVGPQCQGLPASDRRRLRRRRHHGLRPGDAHLRKRGDPCAGRYRDEW